MRAAIPKESAPRERRVAATPATAADLARAGVEVAVEAGAGREAFFPDADYEAAGAAIVSDPAELFGRADLVLKVGPPSIASAGGRTEVAWLKRGAVLVAVLAPASNPAVVEGLAEAGVTSFSLDAVPRISRAQSMDVLSSMGTIAGHKAVLMAADAMPKMCPMLMTAAGTIRPARALIVGAGVAGLQAIATAKRLGAVVTGVDVRPAVKEQIESLGARFVALEADHDAQDAGGYAKDLGETFYKREQEILAPHVAQSDMVITTAMVPGRPAPVLITADMVARMKGGSVIVDLAAPAGGNCTLSRHDEKVLCEGVTIFAPTNLPSAMPLHASQMFSHNVWAFLTELLDEEGNVHIDMENEIIAATLVTHEGRAVHADEVKS